MALQLLKRNYTMEGYEAPKILKLPQGETRWAPRRPRVDVGDVMMNIRMDDSKNKYIEDHVSKYSQGLNPYGEWGYPYKINKNNIRPPIIDPKFYEPLSRMPVKFDAVTAGPIVKDLYGKRVKIAEVAPKTIIDKVCPDVGPRPSARSNKNSYQEGSIDLHLKQPRASIPYHPSIPVHKNTGVPEVELDPKIVARPQMGIHFPFHVSDQSRDINNMRTPMHVAVKPGYKGEYTFVQPETEEVTGINDNLQTIGTGTGYNPGYTLEPEINTELPLEPGVQTAAKSNLAVPTPTVSNITRDGYDLAPKVQTSAWYNPSYFLTDLSGYSIGNIDESCIDNKVQTSARAPVGYKLLGNQGPDVPINVNETPLHASRQTNVSSNLLREGELGKVFLPDSLQAGEFGSKASIPQIQEHQEFSRVAPSQQREFFFVDSDPATSLRQNEPSIQPQGQVTGIRSPLQLQQPRDNRTAGEQAQRVVPVGTGRFVHNPF